MTGPGKEFKERVLLGSGGQGKVYRAREAGLDRRVALKSLRYANQEEKLELLKKACGLSALSLYGIPRLLRFFCRGGSLWLVMEYIEGIPLVPSQCRKWPEPLRQRIVLLIAEALDVMHRGGWTHGDLKPSNILLTREGTVALLDMGFARHTDECVTPRPSGTLAYMAPEVKLNAVHDPRRADIYSFGVLLHEMLYGFLPGEEGTDGFPGDGGGMALSQIIKNCIALDPYKRFESAAVLKKELFAALPFAGHEIQPNLGKTVEPLLRERMRRCCLDAAAEAMKKRKEDAYHLICEALDWDPESSEALIMLQKIRSPSKRWRASLSVAVAAVIAALGVGGFFSLKVQTSFPPPSHEAVLTGRKEYLEPRRLQSPAGVPAEIPLRVKQNETRFSAQIDVRGMPPDAALYLDDSLLGSGGSRVQREVTAGGHVLHVRNSSGIVWRKRIDLSPFETLRLQVRTTEP